MWLRWLLADLVVPLLRAHFYCTEAEAYRQQVFYYRCAAMRAAGAVPMLQSYNFSRSCLFYGLFHEPSLELRVPRGQKVAGAWRRLRLSLCYCMMFRSLFTMPCV